MTYAARMEGAVEKIVADSLTDAIAQAEDWARDGSWDTSQGTIWVHAWLIETDDATMTRAEAMDLIDDYEADPSPTRTCDNLCTVLDGLPEQPPEGEYSPDEIREMVEQQLSDDNETQHAITVQIDPEEPDCIADQDHDWQSPVEIVGGIKENPGVWGHGGGVKIHEVCIHCGCEKVTDTWAQDPETGEQGLTSVEYREGKYADEVSEIMRSRVEFSVEHSLNEGQALVIARVDSLSATYVVAAEEADDEGYVYGDTDTWPLSGDWPAPPDSLIEEARELAAAWEGI